MGEDTYRGRVERLFHMLDVRHAFVSRSGIEDAVATDARCRRDGLATDACRGARHLVASTVHPDTGSVIAAPLRLSFIVPMNMMLDGLMVAAKTPLAVLGSQWLNQTYNAAHYYAQRNASNDNSLTHLGLAYVGATTASVSVAMSLKALGKRWPVAAVAAPFLAVAAADVVNLGTMRHDEWMHGIVVRAADGTELGRSRRAGALAVSACIAARVFAAAPILLTSSVLLREFRRRGVPAVVHLPVTLAVIGAAIQFSVPVTFGLFKQAASAPVPMLEPEFRAGITDGRGHPVTTVYYNKGL